MSKEQYLYPAYAVSASTLEDYYTPNRHTWPDWMERQELTDRQLHDAAWARFAKVQQTALAYDPDRPTRSVVDRMKCSRMTTKRLGMVPWVCGWFSHQTFRDGRSDDEIYNSFSAWVEQYRWMQDLSYVDFEKNHGQPYVCLMGAEDHWRWKLCECQTCKDEGVAVFTH